VGILVVAKGQLTMCNFQHQCATCMYTQQSHAVWS